MTDFEHLCAILKLNNWQDELTNRGITIKWSADGTYFLLKYSQLSCNFNDPVVRACRGIIFRKDKTCVCHPFDKFGNYGESYVPDMDWSTCEALEKIDGSLMKVWYDNGWHLSTNGSIDAYETGVGDLDITFGELFEKILGKKFADWANTLNKDYTYMFELTSPENHVVVDYTEPKIWYLARRNIFTHQEDNYILPGFATPKRFKVGTLQECVNASLHLTKDEEGYVVCDANYNRLKVKSPAYLEAAHLMNNGKITVRRVIRMMQEVSIDDFLAYCPSFGDFVASIQDAVKIAIENWETAWEELSKREYDSQKDYALAVQAYPKDYRSYLFAKKKNEDLRARDYILGCTMNFIKSVVDHYRGIDA